jgi:hypothetical protein
MANYFYYTFGDKLGVVGTNNYENYANAASNKVIKIQYVKNPTALASDSSTPDIPSRYHHALVERVLYFLTGNMKHEAQYRRAVANARGGKMSTGGRIKQTFF